MPELLAETGELPGNVVEVLVGEAFSRLDAPAQQVMQALAIYTVPVSPVAVDYLLQPHRPAVDAAPVLSRLVNMQFVRREAGRHYLHQVDRDYALSRLPAGDPADRDADPAPFTQQALRTAARTTSSRPASRGRTGRPWMTWPPSSPSSSCAIRARTTTPRLRFCSASILTT